MSINDPQPQPVGIFNNFTFWLDASLSERDSVLTNIETHGGRAVDLIQKAHYAIVRPVMSEDLQRTVSSAGIPCIVPLWVTQSVEANRMLPITGFGPSPPRPVVAVPPVSTLQKESSSVSGESTAVESPANAGSLHPAINGDISTSPNDSPVDPASDVNPGESEIDELDQSVTADSPNRRRRGKAYSQEDIIAMKNHFRQQMEVSPRPPHAAIWESFALTHSYRKASSWQQYFYNHKSLFLPNATPEGSQGLPGTSSSGPVRPSDGYDPWGEEDEVALVSFLAKTKKPSLDMEDWTSMAREAGKSRSGRSYMMKYHKNRANYDTKSGRIVPNFANAAVSKQTAFVPLAQEGSLKRNRPLDLEWPESAQRPARVRARRRSHAEGGGDEDEDEIMGDTLSHQPLPQSPSSGTDLLARYQANGLTSSPAPVAAASWMTSFTPDDKAAALTWAVSRPQPADFLDNLKSWIEFAETHPSHTAPEWVCHYLSHFPTFQSVESNLGGNQLL